MKVAFLIFVFVCIVYSQGINNSPLYGAVGEDGINENSLVHIDPLTGECSASLVYFPNSYNGESLCYNPNTNEIWRFQGSSAAVIGLDANNVFSELVDIVNLSSNRNWRSCSFDEQNDLFIMNTYDDDVNTFYYSDTNGNISYAFAIDNYRIIKGIAFSADGSYYLTCDSGGNINKYDYDTNALLESHNVVRCYGLTRDVVSDQYFMAGQQVSNDDDDNVGVDRWLMHFDISDLGTKPVQYIGSLGEYISAITYTDTKENLSCCKPHFSGGCEDIQIAQCVCQHNSTCCFDSWTQECVKHVQEYGCGDCATGSCCAPHAERGCQNRQTSTCVCNDMPSCCTDSWTVECVQYVTDNDCGECTGDKTDCCESHNYPKCSQSKVSDCVCKHDIFCCDVAWDESCVDAVDFFECGECDGDYYDDEDDYSSAPGDCCIPKTSGSCSDLNISECVCEIDPYCCNTKWDSTCVDEISEFGCSDLCPYYSGSEDDGENKCCEAQSGPGCTDSTVNDCVCYIDPYCCENVWDNVCVGEIEQFNCGTCGISSYEKFLIGSPFSRIIDEEERENFKRDIYKTAQHKKTTEKRRSISIN
eukprot:TRINITY_DN482_c0_g1_i6.p1 TRINITY_DN482_c0_g1~~TRINITY_DN482_c0_g1_i6.p1  ORF type:complete len:587 (-),score=213.82 TRINITY_DN482_c0_g1_i6:84-1844(-)